MSKIDEVFLLPPMALARLGASDTPLVSFTWIEDPSLHGAGRTVISPCRSLEVLHDGSLRPFHPAVIQFRDGDRLRPVAPFFELWARSGDEKQPITLRWLKSNGGSLAKITYTVSAANRKAARRCGDPLSAFSVSITVAGNDHTRHPLLASSPKLPTGEEGLVFSAKPIPLGHFQVIRPVFGKVMDVDLDVVRVRFTPARGEVYGPRGADNARAEEADAGTLHTKYDIVPSINRILNPVASWAQYTANNHNDSPEPSDTYDGAGDSSRGERSFGVVDDTCDVVLRATVVTGRKTFSAEARVFCAPPDFAPDRRPFCSLAEELLDRDPTPHEAAEPLRDAVIRLGDLFQRVHETASLANLDMMRNFTMPEGGGPRNFSGMPSTTIPASMTKRDPMFDKDDDQISAASRKEKLPYSTAAAQVHAPLADADDLAQTLRQKSAFVRKLIRPAYAHFKDLPAKANPEGRPDPGQRDPRNERDRQHDMRMPPYMRDSDATALSLNRSQYEFLLRTLDRLKPPPGKAVAGGAAPPDFNLAQEHVTRVAKRLSGKASGAAKPRAKRGAKAPSSGKG